jgi:hypothetical protein
MAYGARLYPKPLISAPAPHRSAPLLVTEPASGDRVFSGTLTSTGTASSSEYFNPTERIQVATERAIQDNIRKLIATLHGLKR